MQFKILSAGILYIGSYLPLSMILFVQDLAPNSLSRSICTNWMQFSDKCEVPLIHAEAAVSVLAVCTVCFILSIGSLYLKKPNQKLKLTSVKYIPSDLMNYVLPYIVSFISLDYGDLSKLLGFLIFLVWLFLITYRSGLIILNPVFSVFGWRLYEIDYLYLTSNNSYQATVLSNKKIAVGEFREYEIIQDIFIIKN